VYAGLDPLTGRPRYLRETAKSYDAAEKALTKLQGQVDEDHQPGAELVAGAGEGGVAVSTTSASEISSNGMPPRPSATVPGRNAVPPLPVGTPRASGPAAQGAAALAHRTPQRRRHRSWPRRSDATNGRGMARGMKR